MDNSDGHRWAVPLTAYGQKPMALDMRRDVEGPQPIEVAASDLSTAATACRVSGVLAAEQRTAPHGSTLPPRRTTWSSDAIAPAFHGTDGRPLRHGLDEQRAKHAPANTISPACRISATEQRTGCARYLSQPVRSALRFDACCGRGTHPMSGIAGCRGGVNASVCGPAV